jgi:hypothetical protein
LELSVIQSPFVTPESMSFLHLQGPGLGITHRLNPPSVVVLAYLSHVSILRGIVLDGGFFDVGESLLRCPRQPRTPRQSTIRRADKKLL